MSAFDLKIETSYGNNINNSNWMKKGKQLEVIYESNSDVKVAQEWGEKMFDYSRSIVAVRTGNLRDRGIKLEKTSTGFKFWVDDEIAPYGKWLERGTRKMRAQSFYFPSVDKHTEPMIEALKNYYRKKVT